MILEKMRSCFWKLKVGFWTYDTIHLVGPVGPNVVSRPQTPMPRNFRDFMILLDSSQDFVENEVLFFKIEARFLD